MELLDKMLDQSRVPTTGLVMQSYIYQTVDAMSRLLLSQTAYSTTVNSHVYMMLTNYLTFLTQIVLMSADTVRDTVQVHWSQRCCRCDCLV